MGSEKKIKIIVMDPVQVYRDSIINVLEKYFNKIISIVGVAKDISELIRIIVNDGPADIYLMEVYGKYESYKSWGYFTDFIALNSPSSYCLVWSSKPTMFIRKFSNECLSIRPWQLHKKISLEKFLRFFLLLIDNKLISAPSTHLCIGPPISNLTQSEVIILSSLLEGDSMTCLSKRNRLNYKTISSHKRNAMSKMRISTTAQLYGLFIGGNMKIGVRQVDFPIEGFVYEPICI